jgi:hypothetical protein
MSLDTISLPYKIFFKFLLLILLAPCQQGFSQSEVAISGLRFLGEYDLPHHSSFKETTVGGLSGIDYDKENDIYYIICDDRSGINDARFYTAKIYVSLSGIDSVKFTDTHKLLQKNGTPYPSGKINTALAADPEAMRYNPTTGQLAWASEGERNVSENNVALADPSITLTNQDGKYAGELTLPKNLKMKKKERGPRQNGTLEGITFEKSYTSLLAALEEPLFEDGARADVEETNSWVRFYRFKLSTKKNVAQYAYRLERIAYKPQPANGFKVNGISDILSVGEDRILVIERSYSTGRSSCTIKVFFADLAGAEDCKKTNSLSKKTPRAAIAKNLLFNMDDLGMYIDNIEGVTLGPELPNGNRSLIFVSDNNFQPTQKTQFLLFEIIP